MSDPVTNLEIEDVLSSIRRLVAEGDKLRASTTAEPAPEPKTPDPMAEAPEAKAPEPAEKFVLTSALRVDEEPKSTVLLWDDVEPEQDTVDAEQDEKPQEAAIEAEDHQDAEPDDSGLLHSDDAPEQSDFADDIADDDEQHLDAPSAEQDQDNDDTLSFTEETSGDISVSEPEVDSPAEGRSRLETTIAELEAAITGQQDEWEPDGSEATPVMDWATDPAEATFLSTRQAANTDEIEDAQEVEDAEDQTTKEPLVLRASPVVEETSDDEISPEPEQLSEQADIVEDLSDDLDRSEPGALDGELEETLTAYLEEDEILDEETLRNLVVEIVRQELQGTLGERITRNVRKLVRREIYRVLSSQEFD